MATKLNENRKPACVFVKPGGHNTLGKSYLRNIKNIYFSTWNLQMNWLLDGHLLKLGPLYTRSQGQKNLGANFEHF